MDHQPGSRLFEAHEARLAALDALPRKLWLGSLIHSQGALEPRLGALVALREALRAGGGSSPDAEDPEPRAGDCVRAAPGSGLDALGAGWLERDLAVRLIAAIRQLGLPGLCRKFGDLADQVVSTVLWHLDLIVDYVDRGDSLAGGKEKAVAAFLDEWRGRCDLLDELVGVFGDGGDLLKNMNWDELRGLLKSAGWQEIVRIRRVIESLPEVAAVIRRLGRTRPSDDADASNQVEMPGEEQTTMSRARMRTTRVPELPGETRGVHRSGRIARMLPSETMLLIQRRHRHLRLVWHAHHAERSLLTYEEDERMHEIVHERVPVVHPSPRRMPDRRMEAGPMLICVDTSGSMQGGAEDVAKAVVLEAMRTAHAQRRACHVFAFGGPDEIVEQELGLDAPGLSRLAGFLAQGFRGGTDICGPLERVLERLAEERWQLADLLIASDGEFGATAALASAVARAKKDSGLRVQAVLIGDRETVGLLELADDIFWVRDWRRLREGPFSPVHSKSLTALYFPGALRSPGNDAVGHAPRAGGIVEPGAITGRSRDGGGST